MRCICCNRNLNDYESTIKSASTGEYLDTCLKCLDGLGIQYVGRADLQAQEAAPGDDSEQPDNEVDHE